MSERILLRTVAAGLFYLFIAACGPDANKPPLQKPDWIGVEDENKFSRDQLQNAIDAAVFWDQSHGCGYPLRIGFQERGMDVLPLGHVAPIYGIARPGYIGLSTSGRSYLDTLFLMTQACRENGNTMVLEKPLDTVLGRITGYNGLMVKFTMKDGDKREFNLFHEGMSERNASILPGYTSPNVVSERMRQLTLGFVPLSLKEANRWVNNNDVPSFVRAVLSVDQSKEVSGDEIFNAMNFYGNQATDALLSNKPSGNRKT